MSSDNFFESHARLQVLFMYSSPFCLLAFARDSNRPCIVLYVAGGFRIKLSVFFVFKLERLSSDFVFTFSKLLNINYFHTCEQARSQKFAMGGLLWGSGGGASSARKFGIFLQK